MKRRTGPMYGRDEIVEALARAEPRLTFLTGDSGVGKTRVLEAAAEPRDGWINATPRRFAASAGTVRQTALEALGDVVAQVIDERGEIIEIGDRLAGAAERLLAENLRELGRVIGAELLEIVRGRLGPNFGQAIEQYVKSLRQEFTETLSARLASAADESVADVLAAFAGEIVELADGRRVGLFFDSAERLNEEEGRLLVDLAERLSDGCHARVALATDSGQNRERVRQLRILGPSIHEIEVEALPEAAVAAWLGDAGLHDIDVARAVRATGGYPLHVGDLIRELELGGRLEDQPLNKQIARRTEASWSALPVDAAAVARKLSVLPDPLPEPRLRELVGLDAAAFGVAVEKLRHGRIFPVNVGGLPWFHEQRRAFVLAKLSPDERDEAATRAAEVVWDELTATDDRRYVSLFAALAAEAKTLQARDSQLAAALALDEPALAAAAALIELMTPENRGAAGADVLFRHARRFTEVEIDAAATIGSLESAGLVVTASNDYATVVVPVLSSQAIVAIEGSAFVRLRRTPIPGLSSLVFAVGVQPRLGDFSTARFGIGHPPLGALARVAGGGDPEVGYHSVRPNRRDPGSHALARATYADRPMWLVASYEDVSVRDEAMVSLESLSVAVLGEQFNVRETFPHPLHVVPEQRFAKAGARAFGVRPSQVGETGDIRVALLEPLSYGRRLELRVEAARLLRERATNLERYAMELDETFGIYWDEGDKSRIECEAYGGEERAVRVEGMLRRRRDEHYRFFQLEQELGLDVNAALRHVSMGFGTSQAYDPVLAEIGSRRSRAFAFNGAQPKRNVSLEKSVLEQMTREGFLRQMEDARAIQVIAPRRIEALPPTSLYVYVLLESPVGGWKPGCGADVIAIERVSETGRDEVHFALSQGGVDLSGFLPRATGPIDDLFAAAFGFPPNRQVSGLLSARFCGVDTLLSEYAGYHEDDLEVGWPDEMNGG